MPFSPERQSQPALLELLSHLEHSGLMRHLMLAVGDVHGRTLYLSERFRQALGDTGRRLLAGEVDLLGTGLPSQADCEAVLRQTEGGDDWHGELNYPVADGFSRWFDTSVFMQSVGEARYLFIIGADVTERHLAESAHRRAESVLGQIVEGDPIPTFVIDQNHIVTHWNGAIEALTGASAAQVIGTRDAGLAFYGSPRPAMADLIVDGRTDALETYYPGRWRTSRIVPDAFEAEGFFAHLGEGGCWLLFTAAPFRDTDGRVMGAIETLLDITTHKRAEEAIRQSQAGLEALVRERTSQLEEAKQALESDVTRRKRSEAELVARNNELLDLNKRLKDAQDQLTQAERLVSIGHLAAGVAHEINNPIGYVQGNLGALTNYLDDIFHVLDAVEDLLDSLPPDDAQAIEIRRRMVERDMVFIRDDLPTLIDESKEGVGRVRKIVADLKDFSRVDTSNEWQWANLHEGLESTLNIVSNEIKYKADVIREYGELPDVECLPSQLNQVFMNLLINAVQAIPSETQGTIRLRTGSERGGEAVWIEVGDSGSGIAVEHLGRVFDPFFTTKPVGKGTGLGLSLSYGIVQKHRGQITVESEPGRGTVFRITLPVRQTGEALANERPGR